jgi:hypothetical protein
MRARDDFSGWACHAWCCDPRCSEPAITSCWTNFDRRLARSGTDGPMLGAKWSVLIPERPYLWSRCWVEWLDRAVLIGEH